MMDFEGVDGYVDVRWQKMKNFTTDLLMLHNAECLDAFRLYFCSADRDAPRHADRWIRRATAIKYHPLVLYIRDCCWPLQYQFPRVGGTLHRLRRLELLFSSSEIGPFFCRAAPFWLSSPRRFGSRRMSHFLAFNPIH